MTRPHRLSVSVFPGAANAPLHAAEQSGAFARRGLELRVVEVRSSGEQMELWETGVCDVMHTSPDHLLRQARPRDPVAVRRDGFGELRVYRRPDAEDLRSVTWAVDAISSGFAFVMRALLEDEAGLPVDRQRLEPVGGTKQRFEKLLDPDGEIGGTTLHPPFDGLAGAAGMVPVAGHLAAWPELLTLVTVVPRESLEAPAIAAYLDAMDESAARLGSHGVDEIETVLRAQGLSPAAARAGALGLLGPGGLGDGRAPTLEGLQAVADLRARFVEGWTPPRPLRELLGGAVA